MSTSFDPNNVNLTAAADDSALATAITCYLELGQNEYNGDLGVYMPIPDIQGALLTLAFCKEPVSLRCLLFWWCPRRLLSSPCLRPGCGGCVSHFMCICSRGTLVLGLSLPRLLYSKSFCFYTTFTARGFSGQQTNRRKFHTRVCRNVH